MRTYHVHSQLVAARIVFESKTFAKQVLLDRINARVLWRNSQDFFTNLEFLNFL